MGLFRFIREHLHRRRYGETPTFRIDDLPDNTFGRVTGVVEALDGELLEAPLSHRPCVYFAVIIDEYLAGSGHARELAHQQSSIPFVLLDGDQRAVIDPAFARISAEYDHITEAKHALDMHPRERALLDRYQIAERNWFATRVLRFCEAAIVVDQRISVVGSGAQEIDPAPRDAQLYRERGPTRLRMAGSASTPLLISDRPRLR